MHAPEVLVVEDDDALRGALARGLREAGLVVSTAVDGTGALAAAGGGPRTRFAAVILDIGLPDSDGRDVCQALRSRGIDVPVLFLTARDQLHDVLAGFAAGGDDHLAKPFHVSRSRRTTATRRTGQSLRGRLAWVATSVTAGWLVALAVGGTLLLGVALSGQADDVLRARAEATAATMAVGPDGTVTVTGARDDRALDIGTWIFDGTGAVVETPSGSSADLTRIAASLAGHGERSLDLGSADPLRLLALPVGSGDLPATVVTSGSLTPYRQLQRTALIAIGAVTPLVLLGVYLVSRSTLARALRPVQQMSAQAAEWSAEHVERRFGPEPRPTELAELAGTLDGMLDRLAAVLRYERQLSAELSHELRTPLARIQAEIDLVRSRPRGAEELSRAHLTIDAADRVLVEFGRSGGSVEFRVIDDGPGIPADATAHVFEPGFRADPADGHDGAGLGLALNHRLITAVEGRISVANVDSGTGAVFTLRVPAS